MRVKTRSQLGDLTAFAITALAVCIAFAISCNGNDLGSDPTANPAVAIEIDTDPATVATNSDDNRQPGGTVRISASNALVPDPAVGDQGLTLSNSYDLLREIYSGLIRVIDDPADPFHGDLAESWTISDDLKTYTFSLQPDLKFSDGSPVTASDFKWSWERALAMGSDRAVTAFSGIAGAADVQAATATELAGIVAVDDQTLRVDLSDPDPYFLAKAASPAAFVLKRDNVEQWGVDWSNWFTNSEIDGFAPTGSALPVGTGPFKLTTLEFLNRYELERNTHYHGSIAPLGAVIFVVGSQTPEMDAFNADQVNILQIDQATADELSANNSENIVLRFAQPSRLAYLAFNANLAPYDDSSFRNALVAASGNEQRPSLVTPGQSAASNPDAPSVSDLIDASTHADNVDTFTLTFYEWLVGAFQLQFEDLAAQWEDQIGVATRYVPTDPASYDEMLDAGEIEMIYGYATPDYPNPSAHINQLANLFSPTDPGNDLVRLHELIADSSAIVDRVEREARYTEIAEFIHEQALVMPLSWISGESIFLTRPNINGFADPPYSGSRFANVWIDSSGG